MDNSTVICAAASQSRDYIQILLAAMAILGTLISTMATYCLKKSSVQMMVGLSKKAQRKKQLKVTIVELQSQLNILSNQLSQKSDSSERSQDKKLPVVVPLKSPV